MKNIIFIAAPAAGKGTVSEQLVEKYHYAHISTGDILRDMSKQNDEFGKNLRELLQSGQLVSDDIVYEALRRRLMKDDINNGFILDGFPRNIEQAKEYDKILEEVHKNLDVVIYLDVDKEILKKRITGRRICSSCGSTYNVLTGVNTPEKENICNKCGASLYQRSDDNEESFETRYQTFMDKTYPLVKFYEDRNILYIVKSFDPDETLEAVERIIND